MKSKNTFLGVIFLVCAVGVAFVVAGGGWRLLSSQVIGSDCADRVQELNRKHEAREAELAAELNRAKAMYSINTGKMDGNDVFQDAYGKYLDSNKRLSEDFGKTQEELAAFDRMADLIKNLREE